MIGPIEAYRADPEDFARNLWANLVSDAITIAIVVVLILAIRPKVAGPLVGAVIEAS